MTVPEAMNARNEDKKRNLEALDPEQWWMEKKLDGFRLIIVSPELSASQGFSRAGKDQLLADRCPRIAHDLDDVLPDGYTVLDGELSTADDNFKHVAGVMKSLPPLAVEKQEATGVHLEYVVFDVLWWNGLDVRSWPQHRRRDILLKNLPTKMDAVRISAAHPLSRDAVLQWQAEGCEGAILKNREAPYISGKRPTDTWLKIKAIDDADVVVMGFTQGQGKYEGQVGAVQFGQYRKCSECDGIGYHGLVGNDTDEDCTTCNGAGRELVQRGQCSGMTDELRLDLTRNWPDFVGRVMVVQHMGIDAGDRAGFRHPQFKGFREDKLPAQCLWD